MIRGMGSVSGLGCSSSEVKETLASGKTTFSPFSATDPSPVSRISSSGEASIHALVQENPVYGTLDRSVQLAMVAARQALQETNWTSADLEDMGVNIGSSRGATGMFEQYHQEYLLNPTGRLSPAASPNTTLGNVASWVAQDLQAAGPVISHSVTCSTAIQAFANGVAWLKSGLAKRFMVGGTEAPLTPFTVAQMKAIGIYSTLSADNNPCRPLNSEGLNTFVLGEGAAVFALERMTLSEMKTLNQPQVLVVSAVGLGFEKVPSKTGLTPDGQHFQKAMQAALAQANLGPQHIQGILVHAPGTKAGDAAEMEALHQVFGNSLPTLHTVKNQIGHTLGASGALSVMAACHLLGVENLTSNSGRAKSKQHFLVNAAGFGGNCASILLSHLVSE